MADCCFFKIILSIFLFSSTFIEAKQSQDEIKQAVAPYLMPEDHPLLSSLNDMFESTRATFNLNKMIEAGFRPAKPRKHSKLIVSSHPSFPGYLFKFYLDTQTCHIPESDAWILRCDGAEKIRQLIATYGLELYVKVPQKWIYELPMKPAPPDGYLTRSYILVEEDADLVSNSENLAFWSSDRVTFDLLESLYLILKNVGLRDCLKLDNIPFSHDGRVSFIDTEFHGLQVNYKMLNPYLSKSNRHYWESITQ